MAYRRRRISVLVVAIVAAAATLATSPSNPQGHVNVSTPATVTLSDLAPRAVGRLVLTLSPGTLPLGTTVGPTPKGTVSFVVSGPGGTGAGGNSPVSITATAIGIPIPAQPDQYTAAPSWPIDQLCRIAEPCRREFDVSAEWLQPRPETEIDVQIAANVAIVYDRWESPPPGANATWEVGEFRAAAPPPAVLASVDLGRITLDRDSPMAARHVLLHGSAALLADPTTEITAYVRSDATEAQPWQTMLTVVADDAADQRPADAAAFIQPFTGCPRAEECVRGFTVVARWMGTKPEDTVDVDWSFDAIARFVDSAAIPPDATLVAKVDQRLDLGLASPRLQGRAAGSFDLVPANGKKGFRLRLVVTPPSLGDAFFGASPPAVALVRLHAAVKDPGASAGLLAWVTGRNYRSEMGSLPLADDGTELQTIALPLDGCLATEPCIGSVEIFVDSQGDRDATISWDVTIELPVPTQALAAGQLKVEVASAP